MTLTLKSGTTQRIVGASRATPYVDFGELPTGTTTSSSILRPGTAACTTDRARRAPAVRDRSGGRRLVKLGTVDGRRSCPSSRAGWDAGAAGREVDVSGGSGRSRGSPDADGRYRITGNTDDDGLVGGNWTVTATPRARRAAGGRRASRTGAAHHRRPRCRGHPSILIRRAAGGTCTSYVVVGQDADQRTDPAAHLHRPERRPAVDRADLRGRHGCGDLRDRRALRVPGQVLPLTYNLNISGGNYSPLRCP